MTILVVDVSTVTTESRAQDRFRFRAPQVRASSLTPGVVSTDWTEVPTPEGPVEVIVEPGPLEVQLLSKRPGPKFQVVVPNVERVAGETFVRWAVEDPSQPDGIPATGWNYLWHFTDEERPLNKGKIAFYVEDAEVEFTGLVVR